VIYSANPDQPAHWCSELLLSRAWELPPDLQPPAPEPPEFASTSARCQVTECGFVPMVSDGKYLGVLALWHQSQRRRCLAVRALTAAK